ncbi:hypothetical protein HDU92_005658 [Lobulomyces angularis]|nr:hypothetical protein HDU92_005658 [Lobulomyces angularis]
MTKASWYINFIVKSTIYGGGIVGVGYMLLKTTVPSESEMRSTLNLPKNQTLTEEQKKNKLIMEKIFQSTKSDKPVWDLAWDENNKRN